MLFAKTGIFMLVVATAACSTSADQVAAPPTAPAPAPVAAGTAQQISADSAVSSTQPAASTAVSPSATAGSTVAATTTPAGYTAPATLPEPTDTQATSTNQAGGSNNAASATTPAAATTTNGNVVTFHIRAGTGSGAWNSAATPIQLSSGQTLQVVNDDTVTHWVHSNEFFPGTGGGPFPHPGSGIDPGQTASYNVDSNYSGQLHDHLTSGPIFFSTGSN